MSFSTVEPSTKLVVNSLYLHESVFRQKTQKKLGKLSNHLKFPASMQGE